MNVSEQIIKVLDNLCQKFGMVIDWTSDNVMPYLQELCSRFINYEIVTSIAWVIITLVICMICWIVFITTFKKAKEFKWDEDFFIVWINCFALVFSIGFSIATIIVIAFQTFDILEAIYLPEKTIYEFISYQIKLLN